MIPREVLQKIRRIQIRTSHKVDEMLAGTWHSAFKGRGIEFEEVRPYQIGDDVHNRLERDRSQRPTVHQALS